MAPSPLSSPVPPRVRNVLDRITPPTPLLEPDEILLEPLEQLLREAGRFRLLEPWEEIELAKAIERGDLAAKDRLINCNLRLVVDRKSTRLNSSHANISYAVFCLKKKKNTCK